MNNVINARNAFFATHVSIENYSVYGPIEYNVKGYGYVSDPIQCALSKEGSKLIDRDAPKYSFAIWKERLEEEAAEMCAFIREKKMTAVIFMVDEDFQYWFIDVHHSLESPSSSTSK